jgi:flagellar motor switch protein FliG
VGKKIIVLTMYGKDESIESISISLFDRAGPYYSETTNNALNYCENINDLELKDNHWIHASIVNENEKVFLLKPPKLDILNKLHDRSLQRVLQEVSRTDLARALRGVDEAIKEKVLKNMSKRSATMLREDMESLHEMSNDDIRSSRNRIIEAIQRLSSRGEIVVAAANRGEL